MRQEQLAFDFSAAYKADLILYLANALRHAIATMRAEYPARTDIPQGWDALVDEALEYANAGGLDDRDEMRRILLARESATSKRLAELERRIRECAWDLRHGESVERAIATLEGRTL